MLISTKIFTCFFLLVGCNSFTIVLLPDTQYYTKRDPDTYNKQIEWIVDKKNKKNIKFVIHLGDITHDNTIEQWEVADNAHKMLDEANIPYTVVPGNHDNPNDGRVRNTSNYNTFFGPSRFSDKTWYGGNMEGRNDNNYALFEFENLEFLIVNIEFAPTKNVLCWANKIINNHQNRRVILVTHCYLGHDGDYQNCVIPYGITGSSGQDIWNELVRRHSNIFMILSGHVTGSALNISTGNSSNIVYEILTDYQFEKRDGVNHGNGWMRTLKFVPSKNHIKVATFTVLDDVTNFNYTDNNGHQRYNFSPNHQDHRYTLLYDLESERPNNVYSKNSNSFNDLTVNSDDNRQQLKPAIGMSDNGDFVIVWEDDSKGKVGVYQIYAKGFYAGGCTKFNDIVVNIDHRGQQLKPAIAMTNDGRFVVTWQDDNNQNNFYQIYAAGFNADGTRMFNDIVVNEDYHGQQRNPDIAITDNGNFVITWEDDKNENNVYQIYAAGFNSDGIRLFNDIVVNEDYHGQQLKPAIAMTNDGRFVVTWQDDNNENEFYQIYAAGFNADGTRMFNDIVVNEDYHGQQRNPDIAMTKYGNFVITWEDDSKGAEGVYQIYAAGFYADGIKRFNDIVVNSNNNRQQFKPAIAMDNNSKFVITWEDDSKGAEGVYQIYAAGFHGDGIKRFNDMTVNSDSTGQQLKPAIAITNDGNFVITWEDDINENYFFEILSKGYYTNGN